MKLTPSKIIAIVSALYGIGVQDILGPKRNGDISQARAICVYLVHELCGMTATQIGELFSRTKTAVSHSIRMVKGQMDVDKTLRSQIDRIIWVLTDRILMGCSRR